MPSNMSEKILCFPSSILDDLGGFQGISTDVGRYFPHIVTSWCYVPRSDAETDPQLKQVIPYVLFIHDTSIFSYRRGKKGSESRLRQKRSIGVGGHIEEIDRTLWRKDDLGYQEAMLREVSEEVEVDWSHCTEACVALINDDSDEVGAVHFGVVHLVVLERPEVRKKESVVTESGFIPIKKAIGDSDRYETWSQLCLKQIDLLMAVSQTDIPVGRSTS